MWVLSQFLAQGQLKRDTWWASGAMAAMTCMTRSGGSWFSSATQTTQMEATGCASTASFACTAGSTSWLAERTRLAGVSSSGSSTAGADTKPSPSQVTITGSDFQHMALDAVAARNVQGARSVVRGRSVVWCVTVAPLLSFLVPGLGLGFAATLSGVGELSHAVGSDAHAIAKVSTAFANTAAATSSDIQQVTGEALSVDLFDLQVATQTGALQDDWLGDFRGFFSATSHFTAECPTSEELIAV